ncbi:MAG: T3SS effector HopA1 family protein [Rhizomicrobium sp.]
MVSSRESFEIFLNEAWAYLTLEERGEKRLPVPLILQTLWQMAVAPNDARAIKAPVPPPGLYEVTRQFLGETIPHRCALQTPDREFIDLTGHVEALAAQLERLATGRPAEAAGETEEKALKFLPTCYLHVFPKAPSAANWRIGINVLPDSMPQAMRQFTQLLFDRDDISQIKLMAPGNAAKCDSVLVYLDRRPETYEALRDRIVELATPLAVAPTVSRMWEEIAPGIGEAGEPPMEHDLYFNFSGYRCLVLYLAFSTYRYRHRPDSFDGFKKRLASIMKLFGLDFDAPHLQNPLPAELMESSGRSFLRGYLDLKRAWLQ